MHEKTGRDELIALILDSTEVSSLDAHNRHELARKLHSLSYSEILKQFPTYRYS
jgi:hypothetical protein